MYVMLRRTAVVLAVYIGLALIGRLWFVSLDVTSLLGAGMGVLFLLLALGLMGQRRLSLVLSILLCVPVLLSDSSLDMAPPAVLGQYALLALCGCLLLHHLKRSQADE